MSRQPSPDPTFYVTPSWWPALASPATVVQRDAARVSGPAGRWKTKTAALLGDCFRCWRKPIFPGRHQPSIFGTSELNFRVRDGNGWTLVVINTNCALLFDSSITIPHHFRKCKPFFKKIFGAWAKWPRRRLSLRGGGLNQRIKLPTPNPAFPPRQRTATLGLLSPATRERQLAAAPQAVIPSRGKWLQGEDFLSAGGAESNEPAALLSPSP